MYDGEVLLDVGGSERRFKLWRSSERLYYNEQILIPLYFIYSFLLVIQVLLLCRVRWIVMSVSKFIK